MDVRSCMGRSCVIGESLHVAVIIESSLADCSAIPSSVHFGGVARARARRGRISLESETGRVLTV